jgi:hypothetical protein
MSNQGLAHVTRRGLVSLHDECIIGVIRELTHPGSIVTSLIRNQGQSQRLWTAESIEISREWAGVSFPQDNSTI